MFLLLYYILHFAGSYVLFSCLANLCWILYIQGIERMLLLLGEKPSSSSPSEGAACERVQQKAAVTLARLSRDPDVAQTAIQLKGSEALCLLEHLTIIYLLNIALYKMYKRSKWNAFCTRWYVYLIKKIVKCSKRHTRPIHTSGISKLIYKTHTRAVSLSVATRGSQTDSRKMESILFPFYQFCSF